MLTINQQRIVRTVTIDADPSLIWAVIGDFVGVHKWHPVVPEAHVRPPGASTELGTERVFFAGTESEVVERLVEYDDARRTLVYVLPNPPFDATDYKGQIVVAPDESGKTLVTWSATFRSDESTASIVEANTGNAIFGTGLEALSNRPW